MNLATCHCRNTRCARCGKMGSTSALQPHGSDRGEVRFRCAACRRRVSARTGTAYAGIRTDLAQYALGAKLLAEGLARISHRGLGKGGRLWHNGFDKNTLFCLRRPPFLCQSVAKPVLPSNPWAAVSRDAWGRGHGVSLARRIKGTLPDKLNYILCVGP